VETEASESLGSSSGWPVIMPGSTAGNRISPEERAQETRGEHSGHGRYVHGGGAGGDGVRGRGVDQPFFRKDFFLAMVQALDPSLYGLDLNST